MVYGQYKYLTEGYFKQLFRKDADRYENDVLKKMATLAMLKNIID